MAHEKNCCSEDPHSMEVKVCSECGNDKGQCRDGYCEECAKRLGICTHCGGWIDDPVAA